MAIDYAMRKALLSVCYTAKALTQALVAKAAAKQAKPEESTRPATDEPVDIDALAELLYGIYGQEVLEKVYDVIDAHEGKVEKAWTSGNEDQCPQCGKQYKLRCRCRIGDKQCENGHSWHSCPVHPDRIILGGGHGLGFGCHCQTAIEKAWRETDHPRGEGGRFIPKGSPEARAAATDAVKKAIKGDRTLHPQNLMNHLSILTVKQIRALAREHGRRVPSAIKEDLHRALRSLVGNAANAVVPVEPEKPRDLPLPMEMLREGERSEGRLRRLADGQRQERSEESKPAKAEAKPVEKKKPYRIERDEEGSVRAVVTMPDGTEHKGKWRIDKGEPDSKIVGRLIEEHAAKLGLEDKHSSHAEAVAAGKRNDKARADLLDHLTGNRSADVLADYEAASGHRMVFRVEPRYDRVSGLHYVGVREHDGDFYEVTPKMDSYEAAATEVGEHIANARDPHDAKFSNKLTQERFDKVKREKVEARQRREQEEAQAHEARQREYQQNAAAKVSLDAKYGSVKSKKGTITVQFQDGSSHKLEGVHVGPFLIDKDESDRKSPKYVITHSQSGARLPVEIHSQSAAKQVAAMLSSKGDWNFSDASRADVSTRGHAKKTAVLWREGKYHELAQHLAEGGSDLPEPSLGDSGEAPKKPARKPREKKPTASVEAKPDAEPGFTGTDAQGREWVNGELVARQPDAPTPDQAAAAEPTPEAPANAGEASDKADAATIAPVDMPTDTTAGNAEAKLADATAHRDAIGDQLTDLDRIDYQDAEQRARSRALSEQHAAASHHVRRHEELAQAARQGHPRAQEALDRLDKIGVPQSPNDERHQAAEAVMDALRTGGEMPAPFEPTPAQPAPTPAPTPAPVVASEPEPAGPQQSAFARGLRQVALPEGQRYVHDLPSADAFKLHRQHGDKEDLLRAAGVRMQAKNGKVQAVVVGTDPADVEMRHDALRAAMGGDWSGIQSLAGQGKAAKAEAPPEPPPATVEPAKPSSHGASPDDIPLSLAHDAHYWVSFSPERRAKQTQGDYVSQMDADFQHLAKYANTPEKMEMLREEFARYRDGYRQRKIAWLSAKSRTASPMITGPARFPVERNRKRLETEHRRVEELLDFRERAIKAIKRKLQPELAPIKSSDPEAVSRLVEKVQQLEALQSMMKKVNDAHKRYLKDPKTLDASDLPEKYKERIRNYKPAYSWEPHPFPPYALSNNNASIRSVKERIASLEKMKAGGHKEVQYSGNVSVVEDPDAARIRIHFPGKPERATIDKLKREGFRWSPSEGAWQRHLNNTGRYAVESLLQSLGHTKTGEAEIKPGTDETDVEVPPMLEKPEIVETPPEGTPAALEEAGFTGTDSQGREWVNGEMVSKSHLAYLVKSAFPQMVQALTHVARVVKSAQPNEQPPSVEDVDQLLYGIYGQHTFDILGQLMAKKPITKAWNESDHPRDPKTKRFIPKGSSQARDAAIKAVKDAIHKPDVASAKELTDHLSILTAVQIRQLAREHGKKVPSAIKRDLHKAVEAFMGGSAGKGEATSEARPAEAPQGQKPAATPQQAPQEAAGKSEAKASGGDWRELDRTGNGDFEKAAKGAAATIAKYGLLGREDTGLLANSDAPFSKRINAAANLDVAVFDQMERAGQLQGFNNEYFRHMRQYDSWVDRPSSTEKLLGEYLDRTVTKTQHVINHMRKLHSQGEKLKLDSGQSVGFDTLADLYEGLLRPMAAETMKAFRSERAAAGIKDHSPKADPATIAPVSLPGEEPAAPAKAEGKSEGKSEAKPRAARKPAAAKKPAATTPAPAAQSGPRRAQHSDRAHAAIEKVRSKMGGPVVPINEVVDAMGGNVHEAHNHMIHLIESGKAHVSRHNSVGHLSPQERAKLLPIGDKHFGDDGKNYAGYLFMTS